MGFFNNLFKSKQKAEIITQPKIVKTPRGSTLTLKPVTTDEQFVRYDSGIYNCKRIWTESDSYTVIAIDTANMYPDSICRISIAAVQNDKIFLKKQWLIRPPYNDFRNSGYNGISFETVSGECTFLEAWPEISGHISNVVWGCYNMEFVTGCLEATMNYFEIPIPNYSAFNITTNIKHNHTLDSYKLVDVLKHFNYPSTGKSNAALAAAVQILSFKEVGHYSYPAYIKSDDPQIIEDYTRLLITGEDAFKKAYELFGKVDDSDICKDTITLLDSIKYCQLAIERGVTTKEAYILASLIMQKLGSEENAEYYRKLAGY